MTTLDKPGKLKDLLENGLYYEYTKAADPIGSGAIAKNFRLQNSAESCMKLAAPELSR